MSAAKRFGLLVLANPILVQGKDLRLNDRCYVETLALVRQFAPVPRVVARTRSFAPHYGQHATLSAAGADLALALPDYGAGGWRGLTSTFRLWSSPGIRRKMRTLVEQAEYIYVEGSALEAFLTAQVARRAGRKLIMEIRGSVVLNPDYMAHRFGLPGALLPRIYEQMFASIRRQSCAGLYINRSLMERYPVAGRLMRAISDAYLPDDFGGSPRRYAAPARCYLFVGHLEQVKRVDLILQALRRVYEQLPDGWQLNLAGSGPAEDDLRALVRQLALDRHVTFHGRVAWGEPLKQLYRQSDLALVASTSESGPRSLIEAMAFGLPAISTAVGYAPELLDASTLAPVGDVSTYADRLARLVNDPVCLTEYSECNWQRAQDFRQPVLEAQRREFWQEAIEASQRPACW